LSKKPYLSLSKILGFYPDNLQIYEQALLHKSSSVETGAFPLIRVALIDNIGDRRIQNAIS